MNIKDLLAPGVDAIKRFKIKPRLTRSYGIKPDRESLIKCYKARQQGKEDK